ncbi:MAG TPA: hypothetical protein VGO93_29225 [Candidatus Xenobia bacterium]
MGTTARGPGRVEGMATLRGVSSSGGWETAGGEVGRSAYRLAATAP